MIATKAVLPLKKRRIHKKRLTLTLLTIPFLIHVFMFHYVPLLGWGLAFFNYKPGISFDKMQFVGLKYFKLISFYWADVLNALINTLAMSGLMLLASVVPLILAILLTELNSSKLRKLLQTCVTLPNFVSWIIVYALCFNIFAGDGLFNQLLMGLGLISEPTRLLANPETAWMFMTLLNVWKNSGWNAIVYLAAIAGIDQSLYEAAKVDGAGRFRCIWHITLPGLMPTCIVLLLLQVGNLLTVGFDQYFAFNNPVIANKIEVLDLYTYRVGIGTQDYSFATAVSIVKSLVSIVLLFSVNGFAKKVRGESII
ncbi:MAG: ABC transporter permease subunit [Oscillospiraceae bacterium]